MKRLAWLVVWSLVMALTSVSVAQDQSDDSRARELYVSGTEAADAGRWADALKRFEASYALEANAAALFNAAVALRALGRHKEARGAFDQVLRAHDGDLDDSTRANAEKLRSEEAARLATVRIETFTECRLRLDGVMLDGSGSAEHIVEIDPGRHSFSAECPERHPVTREITASEGAQARATLKPELIEPVFVTKEAPPKSPLPWVLVGVGGAVAIAGGVLWGLSFDDRATVEGAADGTAWIEVESANDRAVLFSWLGPTLVGAGLASVLGGLIWFQLDDDEPAVGMAIDPTGVRVRF